MLATPELIRECAQTTRLAHSLERSRGLPLYRESLGRMPRSVPLAERLRALPFLTKPRMREGFPENFLGPERPLEALISREEVELEHTSGTSSERLPVILGRGWWAEQEERALGLNPVVAAVLNAHPGARRAAITSPACTGLTCPTGWLSREQRSEGNTLFVNLARIPFLLPESELDRMAAEITDWSPQFLDVSPVHGARFALYCEAKGIRFPSLQFILCSYEFVSVVHRRLLERAFGVPVFNLYGSTETGHLLMENAAGEMKPSYDTAYLEVVEVDAAGIGELVVTTLSNDFMPLLRYRIGDFVEHHAQPYGNRYVVHGRMRDALRAGREQRVTTWQVDRCFTGTAGIAHYELRQEESGAAVLRFVAESGGPAPGELRELTGRLEELLQSRTDLVTQQLPALLPAASGKFRLTIPATR